MIVNPAGQEIASNVTSINQRKLKKELSMRVETVGEVVDLSHDVATQVVNHAMNQVPGLVEQMCTKMIAEAMAAFTQVLEERFVLVPREQPEKIDAL